MVLTVPPGAQLGWERGQLDTLLNPNRSVNSVPPVSEDCIARSEALELVPVSRPHRIATLDSRHMRVFGNPDRRCLDSRQIRV